MCMHQTRATFCVYDYTFPHMPQTLWLHTIKHCRTAWPSGLVSGSMHQWWKPGCQHVNTQLPHTASLPAGSKAGNHLL